MEYRVVLPDGAVRNIHEIGHPVFDASGNLVESVGTVIDVTERKRAEKERQAHLWLLESMDRVNRAIQGTNDLKAMMSDVLDEILSIFDCDRAWLVYPCDPGAASWRAQMEHARPDCPGAFALGVDLPMDADVASVFQTARASSGAVRFGPGSDRPVPAQLAERFDVQSLIGMAVYPKIDEPYMFGLHQCSYPRVWTAQEERLFQEIGRRLADALTTLLMFRNLRESEARLAEAQRVAQIGYWDRDYEANRVTWSDEAYRLFGLAPQERQITYAVLPGLIHPEDQAIVIRAIAEALGGGPRYDVEYRVVRPNGEVRILHSRGDVMRNELGEPRRMFGTVQDVTERKRAEEDLRESERRYRETQAELAHANRVTTMGQLTASIAHEVSQPIGAVVINAETGLLRLAAQPPDLKEVRNAFDRIVKAGNQAGQVVGRIRALIQKVPARHDPVDINETIVEVIALTRSEVQRNGVSLRTSTREGPAAHSRRPDPTAAGDSELFRQRDRSDERRERGIAGVADQHRGRWIGRRTRRGAGFRARVCRPRVLERLFDAFYTTKPSGMGIGLSICRSIIEAHGGRVWAGANAPKGAVFQFTLPAVGEEG